MEEREANRLYELKACEMDQRAVKLAMAEEEARKALNMAQRDYNLALVCKGGVGIQCIEVCQNCLVVAILVLNLYLKGKILSNTDQYSIGSQAILSGGIFL